MSAYVEAWCTVPILLEQMMLKVNDEFCIIKLSDIYNEQKNETNIANFLQGLFI